MRFATGFIACDHFEYPRAIYSGRSWRIELGPQSEGTSTTNSLVGNRIIPSKEIFIVAKSETIARMVASHIVGAMTLLQASAVLIPDLGDAFDQNQSTARSVKRLHSGHWSISGFPLACQIVVRASRRLSLQYALAKYKLSCETASFADVDLNPNHWETIPHWQRPEDHVRLATAIVLAYSVIEELALEVRASSKNPSSINGQWNPIVKNELATRLQNAGVNAAERVVWSVRGGKSRLEIEQPPHLFVTATRTPWTRWDVRDRDVEVVDAIGQASYLRSRISSHRLKPKFVRMLSAYDVANVQFLARRLFLETLGYWPPYKMRKPKYRPTFGS